MISHSKISLLLFFLIFNSCKESEVKVGMDFDIAKQILKEDGAELYPLAMEYSPGYSGIEYKIFRNRIISITYNLKSNKITHLTLYKNTDLPPRKWHSENVSSFHL